jgi:tetratricopeptide (TPR) repeat protein
MVWAALGLAGCQFIDQLQKRLSSNSGGTSAPANPALEEAIRLLEAGQPLLARQKLEALTLSDPTSADAFYYWGRSILEGLGSEPSGPVLSPDEQAALDAFNRALSLNPRHAQAALGAGDLQLRRVAGSRRKPSRDPDSPFALALEAYQKALAIDPRLPDAHYRYARLMERGGDFREAELGFGRAAESAATVPEVAPEFYMHYGRFLSSRPGREKDAIDQFELARVYRREDPALLQAVAELWARIGQAQFKERQYSLAEQTLQKAYDLFPDKGEVAARQTGETLRELRALRGR